MIIKATYLVTDQDFTPTYNDNLERNVDHPTEKAALKAAIKSLVDSECQDAEIWVWKLTHILSHPTVEPVIVRVK